MSEPFSPLKAQRCIFTSGLRSLEKLVALALIDFWSVESPEPWPSVPRLQERTGMSRRAVFDALAALREAGAVVVTQNPKTLSNQYDLSGMMSLPVHVAHRCTTRTSAPCAPVHVAHSGSAPGAPAPVHLLHPKEPNEVTQEVTHTAARAPGSPMEGAPQASPKRKRQQKPETALPADWKPTETHREYAQRHGLQLELEADAFRGWAEGRTTVSWNGTFTTRLANQAKWNRERPSGRAKPVVQRGGTFREASPDWLDETEAAQ